MATMKSAQHTLYLVRKAKDTPYAVKLLVDVKAKYSNGYLHHYIKAERQIDLRVGLRT